MKNNNSHRNGICAVCIVFFILLYFAISPFFKYDTSGNYDCETGVIVDKYIIQHEKTLFSSSYSIAYTVVNMNGYNVTKACSGRDINYYWQMDIIGKNKTICTEV